MFLLYKAIINENVVSVSFKVLSKVVSYLWQQLNVIRNIERKKYFLQSFQDKPN